jgi:hypothetical protein
MRRALSLKLVSIVGFLVGGAFALGWLTAAHRHLPTRFKEGSVVNDGGFHPEPSAGNSSATNRFREDRRSILPASLTSIQVALRQLDQSPPSELREDERLKLLLAWAAMDPLAAMDYAKKNLNRDRLAQAMAGIAAKWARNNPVDAWDWARSLGPEQSHHAHTVLEEVGKYDPAIAARLAMEFARQQPAEAVAMCLTAMRGMTYNGNFEAARKLIADVPLSSPEDQAVLLNFMAGQWARFEPERAAEWVRTLPEGNARNQALIGLGESWAEIDPPRAADYATQLPVGPVRQAALRQAIGNWVLADPVAASTWVNKFEPHEDFDQAVASVATMRFLVEEHVDISLSWANSIVSEPLRTAALSEILSAWALRDRPAAMNYAQTSARVPVGIREQLLKQLSMAGP